MNWLFGILLYGDGGIKREGCDGSNAARVWATSSRFFLSQSGDILRHLSVHRGNTSGSTMTSEMMTAE
jgi:hypothetical protein